MSASEMALGFFKTVFIMKDQLNGLGRVLSALNSRVAKLAEAHGDLRDRVSRLEGVIEGAAIATARQRRIEE